MIGERGTQHWSSSFEMVQIFLIQDDSYILRGIKAVHIHSNKFRACHCGMPAISQPAMVWWGAVCIKNQLRVETGLVRGGGHSVQCWLLCSHHVLILSCPGSSVSIQLIIVFVALRPSSDPWVPRPPTAALSPPGHGDQRMTDGDGAWKGPNKALTVCSLLSDVLSKSCCWHLLSISFT